MGSKNCKSSSLAAAAAAAEVLQMAAAVPPTGVSLKQMYAACQQLSL
jgi:hypothetical protein